MLKTVSALATALILSNAAYGAQVACGVEPNDAVLNNEQLWYEVAGSGRLYLYSGPDEKCLNRNLFVVAGDALIAYKEYGKDGEWSSVTYTSKSGKSADGWVHTKRLRFTGASGGDMTPETIKFYEKAAEAAKKGKLGRPE
jgi:hypothetical protein